MGDHVGLQLLASVYVQCACAKEDRNALRTVNSKEPAAFCPIADRATTAVTVSPAWSTNRLSASALAPIRDRSHNAGFCRSCRDNGSCIRPGESAPSHVCACTCNNSCPRQAREARSPPPLQCLPCHRGGCGHNAGDVSASHCRIYISISRRHAGISNQPAGITLLAVSIDRSHPRQNPDYGSLMLGRGQYQFGSSGGN
ncbi:hypothetical protein P3T33_004649 [Rhizobium sp. AN67]|nr:hypothetical protein [Rhizobium sp. AN67]SOD50391.1 hypothetical protein SAMN05216595_0142 [Rhizobium sp. AN6A]